MFHSMESKKEIKSAAALLGALGGKKKSIHKTLAVRENAKKGGEATRLKYLNSKSEKCK